VVAGSGNAGRDATRAGGCCVVPASDDDLEAHRVSGNKGDADEFTAFVTARMERWRRGAFLLCGDWHLADDLVSVTVAKVYRRWRTVRRADNPDAYAQRILTRTWLSERRRPWRREHPSADLPDREQIEPDRIGDRTALDRMLTALGPRQRAVLVLRFYLDYSIEDTARILGISTGTVKSQAARALDVLRAIAARPDHELFTHRRG
jgi:RNA polymerase sigma-70 factor (sigma-E family)